MSAENVEAVRRWLALFIEVDEGLADPDQLEEFVRQDGSFTFSGFLEDRRSFHSIDDFLAFRAAWIEPYDDFSYEPVEFLDGGDSRVLVMFRQRGKLCDTDDWVEMDYGIVYTVEEGLLSGAVIYADRDKALESAGLSE